MSQNDEPKIPEDFTRWPGGECPEGARDQETDVILRNGYSSADNNERILGRNWSWEHCGGPGDILAYRILKPAQPDASSDNRTAVAWMTDTPYGRTFSATEEFYSRFPDFPRTGAATSQPKPACTQCNDTGEGYLASGDGPFVCRCQFQGDAVASSQPPVAGDVEALLRRELEDAYAHGLLGAPFSVADCARQIARRLTPPRSDAPAGGGNASQDLAKAEAMLEPDNWLNRYGDAREAAALARLVPVGWADAEALSAFKRGPDYNGQNVPVTIRHNPIHGDLLLYTLTPSTGTEESGNA